MTTRDYYRHIRHTMPAARATEALRLAREAAALDEAAAIRRLPPPAVVQWEDGVVRLSFGIKVF